MEWALSADYYRDPLWLQREKTLFYQNQILCFREAYPRATEFKTLELPHKDKFIAINDEDKNFYALSNICRHRGATVELSERGALKKNFSCPYHGWCFDMNGHLTQAPFASELLSQREDLKLPSYPVDFWGPYALLDPHPELMEIEWGDYQYHSTQSYTLQCNWKVLVDNYLDGGYHVPTVHPTLKGFLKNSTYKIINAERSCLQRSETGTPLKGPSAQAGLREGMALYYWIFPNLMINFYDGVVDVNRIYPLGVDKCLVEYHFFFGPRFNGTEGAKLKQQSIDLAHKIQLEDNAISEQVQENLHSAQFRAGPFALAKESGVRLFHQLIKRHYDTF